MANQSIISMFPRDPQWIRARRIESVPGAAVLQVGEMWDLHLRDVEVIDRMIGALLDARRIVAPDDPVLVVGPLVPVDPQVDRSLASLDRVLGSTS